MLRVALAGRPNVGKSTLFNKLTGQTRAMVAPVPGVTRDTRIARARFGETYFEIVDTAGLEGRADGLAADLNRIAEKASREADAVLFLVDGREGITPDDHNVAEILRRMNKPVLLLVNKSDTRASDDNIYNAYELGFGEPVAFSAEHAMGFSVLGDFLEPLILAEAAARKKKAAPAELEGDMIEDAESRAPDSFEEDASDVYLNDDYDFYVSEEEALSSMPDVLKLAIVGRPNAGKSTLVNAILGEERMLTGDMAGLTRESIGSLIEVDGQRIEIVDTPGLRKRSKITENLEQRSAADALTTMTKAHAILLLVDASLSLDRQDIQIAEKAVKDGKPLLVVANKWDLVEDKEATYQDMVEDLFYGFHQIKELPFITISALKRKGIEKIWQQVLQAVEKATKRIPTSKLNRVLELALNDNPPPSRSGRALKFKFMTQVVSEPPTFVVWSNRPEVVPDSYKRYLMNVLREECNLGDIPIRMFFRGSENPYEHKRRRR